VNEDIQNESIKKGERYRWKEEAGKGEKNPKTTKNPTLFDYIILILNSFLPFIKCIIQCADTLQFIKKT